MPAPPAARTATARTATARLIQPSPVKPTTSHWLSSGRHTHWLTHTPHADQCTAPCPGRLHYRGPHPLSATTVGSAKNCLSKPCVRVRVFAAPADCESSMDLLIELMRLRSRRKTRQNRRHRSVAVLRRLDAVSAVSSAVFAAFGMAMSPGSIIAVA